MMSNDQFDLAPESLRALLQQMSEFIVEAFAAEPHDPIMSPIAGQQLRAHFSAAAPRAGTPPTDVIRECRELLRNGVRKNGHPRFFAYVCGSADPIGVLADMLASALNQNVTAWRSAPTAAEFERQVLRWIDELVGFHAAGHGILVSGGSAANFTAIACAIASAQAAPARPASEQLTIYLSREAHLSLAKAARVLGIREDYVRMIPTDERRRLQSIALQRQIEYDLAAGLTPACVCASAGTANTGAIDPLDEIADICARHSVYLHIDGAYGAPAAMTRDYRWMQQSFARADSLSLDPHKWLFAPIDVGCLLLRDAAASQHAFSLHSEYTAVTQTDPIEQFAFFDHGLELSRRFRALKVWMILKTRGADAIARVIERNIALRRYLDERVASEPGLEALGSDLSISCFRFVAPHVTDGDATNRLNQQILERLLASGRMYLSPTTLEGRYALRVCIVNFRTKQSDIDELIDQVLSEGNDLLRHSAP